VTIDQLEMDEIEGEYKPIGVINDHMKELPVEMVRIDVSRMGLDVKYTRRAESGVIIIEFWMKVALMSWVQGCIQHQTGGRYTTQHHRRMPN
jgi:hypothetical protein